MVRASGWLAEQHAAEQRRFLHLLAGSFVAHALLAGILSIAPTPDAPLLPAVLRVDLVASLPAAAPAPKPAPVAKPAPAPAPVPKQVVLPKQAPRAVPKKVAPAVPRPKPVDYEDALSQLRNELGETAPEPRESQPDAEPTAEAAPAPAPSAGLALDRDVAAWVIATKRHVRSRYITPPEFLNRSLSAGLEVLLTSGGELVGAPRVVRPSGDPFFDDNAVRAVMTSAPLPAPPRAGSFTFVFTSEER